MRDNEYQEIEHRLTKIEGLQLQAVLLLTQINGRLSALEVWRHAVELGEARSAGVTAGRLALRRRDVAILVGVFSVAGTAAGVIIGALNLALR